MARQPPRHTRKELRSRRPLKPVENQPLKDSLGKNALGRIARSIKRTQGDFDERSFQRSAMRGLEELELKARVSHIIAVLRRFLPQEIPRAIETLAQVKGHWDWGNPDDPLACLAAWPVTDSGCFFIVMSSEIS